jgi:hypothetical protein
MTGGAYYLNFNEMIRKAVQILTALTYYLHRLS